MEKKLNLIDEILDEIPSTCHFFSQKPTKDDLHIQLRNLFIFFNFKNFKRCRVEDITENPDENYYYFIQNLQNTSFLYKGLFLGDRLENLLRQNKNLKVIYLNESESDREEHFYVLNNLIRMSNLDPSQFFVINNNESLKDYAESCESKINTYSIGFLPLYMTKRFSKENPILLKDKKYIFTVHNKRLRSHRYAVLSMLKKENILEHCDWSSLENWKFKSHVLNDNSINYGFFENVLSKEDFYELEPNMIDLSKMDIKKSTLEGEDCFSGVEKTDTHNINLDGIIKNNPYKESYINITTETAFDLNEIHITEKSFIPFNFYQIPLIVASKNHIKTLVNRYGFDMFTDLIDISYDNEPDHKLRLKMVFDEIKKLFQNKEKLINFYLSNTTRLIDNRQKMLNILNDKRDYEFFQSLI